MLREREHELCRLGELIAAARDGQGGALVLEGEAGIGKTRLLTVARELARGDGLEVLAGRGGKLERDFANGVVRQLFDTAVRSGLALERAAEPAAVALGLVGRAAG
jgi:predicted ATPase